MILRFHQTEPGWLPRESAITLPVPAQASGFLTWFGMWAPPSHLIWRRIQHRSGHQTGDESRLPQFELAGWGFIKKLQMVVE